MNKGFLKFKKRLRRSALAKALIFGAAVGVFTSGLLLLILKLNAVQQRLLVCMLSGLGAALLSGLASFLILDPNDRRAAKKIDEGLGLNEKAQTMVAFRDDGGVMTAIQRENTEQILASTPAKALKIKRVWVCAIAPVIACAMLAAAIITPAKEPPAPPSPPVKEEEPFEITNWQVAALEELIEYVERSPMYAEPKALVIGELTDLLELLNATDTDSDMRDSVIDVIIAVYDIAQGSTTYGEIVDILEASEESSVKSLAASLDTLDGIKVRDALTKIQSEILDPKKEGFEAALDGFIKALGEESLSESGVDANDELYLALLSFADDLTETRGMIGKYTDDGISNALSENIKMGVETISLALQNQALNVETPEYVIKKLMNIFGISQSELPDYMKKDNASFDAPDDEEDEDKVNHGGIGDGNVLYGSEDEIYYPAEDRYVSYGEVINIYYASVTEKLIDGEVPPTLEQFISDYFQTLYDGSEKETE